MLISQRFGELALPHGFKVAVDRAFDQFLEKPAQAAEQVAKIYREKGAGAAVALLRELTETADPLTATLTFDRVIPTIERVIDEILPKLHPASGDTSDTIRVFKDLSAVCNSAIRSSQASSSISFVGAKVRDFLKKGGFPVAMALSVAIQRSVAEGHATLAFELIEQLNGSNILLLNTFTRGVADGLTDLRERARDSALKFGKTVSPFTVPKASWDELLTNPDEAARKWLESHPVYKENARHALAQVNVAGYQLTRGLVTANAYLSRLDGVPNVERLRTLSQVPELETDPALASALALSPDGILETARLANTDFMIAAADRLSQANLLSVSDPKMIAIDPNWSHRAAGKLGRTMFGVPLGFKFNLFNIFSYVEGTRVVGGHFQRTYRLPGVMETTGWRDIGRVGMYLAGIGAEGGHALSILSNRASTVAATDPGWKGFVARTAANQSMWVSDSLKTLGWSWREISIPQALRASAGGRQG